VRRRRKEQGQQETEGYASTIAYDGRVPNFAAILFDQEMEVIIEKGGVSRKQKERDKKKTAQV